MRAKTAFKASGWALAVILGAVAIGGAWLRWSPRSVPSGQPDLVVLDSESLPAFRNAFNEAEGAVRVLVLLSPT